MKNKKSEPSYIRKQGNSSRREPNKRCVTFSFTKIIPTQGQTTKEWSDLGLLEKLIERLKYAGQFSVQEAIQNGTFTQYNRVDFPPESEFTQPKHIIDVTWVTMHITQKSKEVVAGFIEDDVYYIIFLDKDHKFWPSKLKNT